MRELIFIFGFCIFFYRLIHKPIITKNKKRQDSKIEDGSDQKNSLEELAIVIPARNEEKNLPIILESLLEAKSYGAKIIVVDDQSDDSTVSVAEKFRVIIHKVQMKPENWSGKNWACHQGYLFLKNNNYNFNYILFTDADTKHNSNQLLRALNWFKQENASLMSGNPFHLAINFWEKLIGSFYLLITMITDSHQENPSSLRYFSIGQFLLFKKDYYEYSGGHFSVKSELAEDLALAKICFQLNKKYLVYTKANLYSTNMYSSFREFVNGWQRNFRLGMSRSSLFTWIETVIVIAALLGTGTWWSYLSFILLIGIYQKSQGEFSIIGALFFPIGVIMFIFISLVSLANKFFKQPIIWKSRNYFTSLIIFMFLILNPFFANSNENIKSSNLNLIVNIEGLKSGNGGVSITLFDSKNQKYFPTKPEFAINKEYKDLNGKDKIEFNFNNLPEGEYAAFAYHDEDGNKKINTNFVGIPTEGYGATQGAKNKFGPPKYINAKFNLSSSVTSDSIVTLKIEY